MLISDQENIKEINYDVKNNKVTISGPFDPHTLTRTLYCKACKIIKKITSPPPPTTHKPAVPKPTKPEFPPGPPCCAKPTYEWLYGVFKCASCGMVYAWTNQCPPPTIKKCHPGPGCCMGVTACGSGTNYQCLPPPAAKENGTDHHEKNNNNNKTPVLDPCRPPEQVCCPRPCYVGMHGGTMCVSCGLKCPWINHQVSVPQPQPHHVYDYGYGEPKPYYFICEDSTPLCTIM